MKRLAIALCLLALTACGDGDDAKTMRWTISNKTVADADRTEIATAIKTLHDVCPGLFENANSIAQAEASIWEAMDYRSDLYGWNREVTLTPTLINVPDLPENWRAGGHTLFYYVGIGGQPGVVMSKDISMMICGQAGQADDLFVPLR